MTVKRRETSSDLITPEVLEAFKRAEEIAESTDDAGERWEEDGGRRREMLDAEVFVQKALGFPIWAGATVFDVDEEWERPDYITAEDWQTALNWRKRLLDASTS